MEYCGAGSISDLMMKGRFSLKEEEIRYVISQMLLGIAYLHQQRKIHRVDKFKGYMTLGYKSWKCVVNRVRSC